MSILARMPVLAAAMLAALPCAARAQDVARREAPPFFSYDELAELAKDQPIPPALAAKLERLTTTPFVSNEAYYRGARPRALRVEGLGPTLRVMFWNVERGVTLDDILLLLTNRDKFVAKAVASRKGVKAKAASSPITPEDPENLDADDLDSDDLDVSLNVDRLRQDVQRLQEADVVVLNEVDWGMPRSAYREVVVELGRALDMNWAYGTEFVEIDPIVLGTESFSYVEDEQARKELLAEFAVDKARLRALHGTAILSRYPIREATLRPFTYQPYDWYQAEKRIRPTEKGIRAGVRLLGEDLKREMRRGGRTMLSVVLDVPALEGQRVMVVSPHLENRTKPANRVRQMREALEAVADAAAPVILAGDLNTTGSDAESFRLEKHIYRKYTDPDTWANAAVKTASGVGLAYDVFRAGFRFTNNVSDPTVRGVPLLASNKERGLFALVEDFRFADGHAFDFRGDAARAADGRGGTLANSNERAGKGFVHTYEFVVTVGVVGKMKLDWFFVKSHLESPRDTQGPYRFAPHFARTMPRVNFAIKGSPLSDHNPMTIDLPFGEPPLAKR